MQIKLQYNLNMCLWSVHQYMNTLGLNSLRVRKKPTPKSEEQKNRFIFPNVLIGAENINDLLIHSDQGNQVRQEVA